MKKIAILFMLALNLGLSTAWAANPVNPANPNGANAANPEDLSDFTAPFSLVSLMSGELLAPDFKKPNWNLKQISLDAAVKKSDPFAGFKLEDVQFVNADEPNLCLAIDESGDFKLKNCAEDLREGRLESVFTIIPTIGAGVQIRSFVLSKTECVAAFLNPRLPSGVGIGINPCAVDRRFNVPLRNIMLILPPLRGAKVVE